MNIIEWQKNYVSKILPLGRGVECLIVVFFHYAFYNYKILGGWNFLAIPCHNFLLTSINLNR